MSGISGHLVRRGVEAAQVHFVKVTSEGSVPAHDDQPAMEVDPRDYLPLVIIAVVATVLIASVRATKTAMTQCAY